MEFLGTLIAYGIGIAMLIGVIDLIFLFIQDFLPSRKTVISILALIAGFVGFRVWKKNQMEQKDAEDIPNSKNTTDLEK